MRQSEYPAPYSPFLASELFFPICDYNPISIAILPAAHSVLGSYGPPANVNNNGNRVQTGRPFNFTLFTIIPLPQLANISSPDCALMCLHPRNTQNPKDLFLRF